MEDTAEVPESVSLRTFLTARTQELVALSQRISGRSGEANKSSVPFKHIPKNLRRRAVSHNVKRLPFRFRPKGQPVASGSKGDPLSFISSKKQTKTGSRKHRRRKSNMLLEFNRRQRKYKWMETHIWHAKRFHMEPKWNHKIPIAPCDKGRRALYRSTKSYVTMQDVSFLSCFELQGVFSTICTGFQSIAPKVCNTLSVGALMYASGDREGSLHIYRSGTYPGGYIGNIQFEWHKFKRNENSVLRLWVHPAFSDEFLDELLKVFKLNATPELSLEEETNDKQSIDEIKLLPKNLNQKPSWTSDDGALILIDMRGALNRIRFSGPECLLVFKEVLQTTSSEFVRHQQFRNNWLRSYCDKINHGELDAEKYLKAQTLLWSTLENAEDFPSQIILPLIVRDPRVFLPQRRTKILLNNEETDDDEGQLESSPVEPMEVDGKVSKEQEVVDCQSVLNDFVSRAVVPLDDPEVQVALPKEKMTDHEFCKRRAGLLIPGSQIQLGEDENQIPIILINRPGSPNSNHFSDRGFDLVIPAGWTMTFWIAFAYRATRVCGLRDAVASAFESSNLHSCHFLPPDSRAGSDEELVNSTKKREDYFKLPPAKRPNLIKLSCATPFQNDWSTLLAFWNNSTPTTQPHFILRDVDKLNCISRNVKTKFWKKLIENLSSIPDVARCLIGIRLEILGRGVAEEGAVVSIPSDTDHIFSNQENVSEAPIHTEPCKEETLRSKERAAFHAKHQQNMAFLRRKRKKIRRKNKGKKVEMMETEAIKHYDSAELSKLYNEKINALWLIPQSDIQETYKNLSRKPMGFVVYGGNQYSRGKCSALAYVSAQALIEFAEGAVQNKRKGKFLLVRNWDNSYIYRAAKFEILQL